MPLSPRRKGFVAKTPKKKNKVLERAPDPWTPMSPAKQKSAPHVVLSRHEPSGVADSPFATSLSDDNVAAATTGVDENARPEAAKKSVVGFVVAKGGHDGGAKQHVLGDYGPARRLDGGRSAPPPFSPASASAAAAKKTPRRGLKSLLRTIVEKTSRHPSGASGSGASTTTAKGTAEASGASTDHKCWSSPRSESEDGSLIVGSSSYSEDPKPNSSGNKNKGRGTTPEEKKKTTTNANAPGPVIRAFSFPVRPRKSRISEQPFAPLDFAMERVLGRGAYGVVYLVRKRAAPDADRIFAMKVMRKGDLVRAQIEDQAFVERDVTRDARHAFVARLRHAFQTESRLYLLSDYFFGGPLHEALLTATPQTAGRVSVAAMRFYAAELVLGVAYLHSKGIIHRDLKPPNILVDASGHVAITDLGMAIQTSSAPSSDHHHHHRGATSSSSKKKKATSEAPRSHMFCGTDEYMAPEIFLRGKDYGFAVDWWALGVCCYDMVAGRTPFRPTAEERSRDCLDTNVKIRRRLWENIIKRGPNVTPARGFDDPDAAHFLEGLLRKSEAERPCDARAIQSDRFFNDYDWDRAAKKQIPPPFVP